MLTTPVCIERPVNMKPGVCPHLFFREEGSCFYAFIFHIDYTPLLQMPESLLGFTENVDSAFSICYSVSLSILGNPFVCRHLLKMK